MSNKVEKTVGGLVQSLFGGFSSQSSLFGSTSYSSGTQTQPSLAFLAFLEKVQEAWKQSHEVS